MGVVLLQILQWVLRIIVVLLLLILGVVIIVLVVPIRYQAEGEFYEKKPGIRGKITWFFYLIYMTFRYEDDFQMQVRVCGFKVYDSSEENGGRKVGKKAKEKAVAREKELLDSVGNISVQEENTSEIKQNASEEDKASEVKQNASVEDEAGEVKQNASVQEEISVWEKELEAEAVEEAKLAEEMKQKQTQKDRKGEDNSSSESGKKTLGDKVDDFKQKVLNLVQKIKDVWEKVKQGKLKVEHYLELWNRKETQVTFQRAKTKLYRMMKAVLPRKWKLIGEVGFADPCTTGQFMGVLGALYPVVGNKVQVVPNFDNQIINVEGCVKGHIRFGNLLYQVVSLIVNKYSFQFFKLIFDELGVSKKKGAGKKKNK